MNLCAAHDAGVLILDVPQHDQRSGDQPRCRAATPHGWITLDTALGEQPHHLYPASASDRFRFRVSEEMLGFSGGKLVSLLLDAPGGTHITLQPMEFNSAA